jgi:hypothetical protein
MVIGDVCVIECGIHAITRTQWLVVLVRLLTNIGQRTFYLIVSHFTLCIFET